MACPPPKENVWAGWLGRNGDAANGHPRDDVSSKVSRIRMRDFQGGDRLLQSRPWEIIHE
jgi:hypothetical protein